MSRGKFLPFLLNILEETEYIEAEKHVKDWVAIEEVKTLEPFLEWFTHCISHENFLTSDEVSIYYDLKCNNKLVPIEELDQRLSEYFDFESNSSFDVDLQFLIADAETELQSLKSLEEYLKKREKNEKPVDGLEPFIKSEIKDLEALNNLFNETLSKFTYAWDDLKSHLSEELSTDLCLNRYLNVINLNNQINQNLNQHLQNDFKEINATEGKITVTSLDYWLINQKISQVESCIIDITTTMHGNSMILNYLTSLKYFIADNNQKTSLLDIKKFLDEVPSPKEKLSGLLSTVLEDEVNCLVKLQLNDTKKCATFLEDRVNRLTRIENILQNKMILNQTLKFIVKRDRVIRDFQLNALNKFSKNVELLASQYEQRIDNMKNNISVNKIHSLDPNYKTMMKYLGVQNSDYKTLSLEIIKFKEIICISHADIEEDMHLFQKKFANRFNEIKKIDRLVIHGPTREIFGNYIYRNFIKDLRDNLKTQKKVSETFKKVEEMFKTVKSGGGKKDCVWQKILENPKDFLRRLHEIEEETERLKERVRIEVMNR